MISQSKLECLSTKNISIINLAVGSLLTEAQITLLDYDKLSMIAMVKRSNLLFQTKITQEKSFITLARGSIFLVSTTRGQFHKTFFFVTDVREQ
jgi:hypothetical protein